jgi:hypothetical protein
MIAREIVRTLASHEPPVLAAPVGIDAASDRIDDLGSWIDEPDPAIWRDRSAYRTAGERRLLRDPTFVRHYTVLAASLPLRHGGHLGFRLRNQESVGMAGGFLSALIPIIHQ